MEQPIALREWAVAVRALEEGGQTIALRKGGIAEETKEFRLESRRFYLFPSYEHQRPELVKPAYRGVVNETLAEAGALGERVVLRSFAEVVEDLEITDAAALARLGDQHIWTEDYAEERLKWKRTKPLHVLLLRVYTLEEPVLLPMADGYGGCKSWLRLEEELPERGMSPVLTDEEFRLRADAVRRAIAG